MICFSICLVACSKSDESDVKTMEINNMSKKLDSDEQVILLKDGLKDDSLEKIGLDEEGYGALGVNIKDESNQVLLCKDPVYNIVYYVNYGIDYYIYRMIEGKAELAVELPAKRLFCMDGKLYFMLETYNRYNLKDIKNGNIFSYDPITGEVKRLIDTNSTMMYVYEDGIYYMVSEDRELSNGKYSTKMYLYFYSFETSSAKEFSTDFTTLYKWRDYHVAYEVEEVEADEELSKTYGSDVKLSRAVALKLEKLDKSDSIMLTDHWNIRNYTIFGNKLYYILNRDQLIIFDIETKETNKIQLPYQYEGDFTIVNGFLYLDSLLKINLETGIPSKAVPEVTYETIYEFYTDGEKLYGICGPMGGVKNGVMKQIEIYENPDFHNKEDKSITYEVGRYIFRTVPMGEVTSGE